MIFPNIKVQPHWLETLERAAEVMPNCRWVCSAISNGAELQIEEEVRTAISEAIAPFTLVNSWLICETGTDFTTRAEAQKYRIAWIDHMIAQCRT